MKKVQRLFNQILPAIPYLIVFFYSLYQPSDPDLGWHLKYGEYFWQHGSVLRDNTFSIMMPTYHWANTSWLTDIIAFSAYHFGGLFGLTLLSATVVTATFFFFAKAASLTLWEQTLIFPLILYLEDPVNNISFRGQQVSLLFGGVLWYLISQYEKKPKILWLALPLFLVWADVDGEFVLGVGLFSLWALLYLIKKIIQQFLLQSNKKEGRFTYAKVKAAVLHEKKEIFSLLLFLVGSFLVTFINPFGYGIHLDALSHIGSPLLKDIGEYLPFQMYSQEWWSEIVVGIILVFGMFILGFRGKFMETFPFLGGGLVLFLLSMEIRRYAWPAYYLLFPLLAMTATFLRPDGKKQTKIAISVLLPLFLIGIIWLRSPLSQFSSDNWNTYCQQEVTHCSPHSAQFLIKHHLTHNLFSLYGWGGWLIWNYPMIKPTIDGRMHLWVENGYSGFSDYFSLEQNMKDINMTSYTVVYMSPDKPVYDRLLQLTRIGKWKMVYMDKYAGIFVRKD